MERSRKKTHTQWRCTALFTYFSRSINWLIKIDAHTYIDEKIIIFFAAFYIYKLFCFSKVTTFILCVCVCVHVVSEGKRMFFDSAGSLLYRHTHTHNFERMWIFAQATIVRALYRSLVCLPQNDQCGAALPRWFGMKLVLQPVVSLIPQT